MRKNTLFTHGTDRSPQERARRDRREAESKAASAQTWRETWRTLEPTTRHLRDGAMDFMSIPSVIGARKDK